MALSVKQLQEERAKLQEEAAQIIEAADKEERRLTADEKTRLKQIEDETANVDDDIAIRARHLEQANKKIWSEYDTDQVKQEEKKEEPQGFTGEYALGEQLKAVVQATMSNGRVVDPRLRVSDPFAAATGLGSETGSEGAFLVQQEYSSEIWKRVYETGNIVSRCRRLRLGQNSDGIKLNAVAETDRGTGTRLGGVQAYWVSQGDEITASAPKFRQIELKLQKLAALCYATDELIADASALQDFIMSELPQELNFMVEDSIFNGVGGGQPLGILNSGAINEVAVETGQGAPDYFLYENAVKMYSRMYGRSRGSAIWTVDQSIEPYLYTMGLTVGTGGSAVFMPAGGASAQPYATLFARPIIPIEYGQAVGTAGDIMFVDLSQYVMIDKAAVESAASMHVRFIYDEMAFRFIYRVDGQPLWNNTLTPKSDGDALSPFVSLAARS